MKKIHWTATHHAAIASHLYPVLIKNGMIERITEQYTGTKPMKINGLHELIMNSQCVLDKKLHKRRNAGINADINAIKRCLVTMHLTPKAVGKVLNIHDVSSPAATVPQEQQAAKPFTILDYSVPPSKGVLIASNEAEDLLEQLERLEKLTCLSQEQKNVLAAKILNS